MVLIINALEKKVVFWGIFFNKAFCRSFSLCEVLWEQKFPQKCFAFQMFCISKLLLALIATLMINDDDL